jgi:diguanylate cyclase (GGDEF)-like protein
MILASAAIFVLSVALGELALRNQLNRDMRLDSERLFVQGVYLSQTIQQSVSAGINVTSSLAMLLRTSEYSPELFELWARELYARNRGIGGIQLAPGGVVEYVYPLEEHRAAIGHDLLADENRKDGAMLAVNTRSMTLIGPIKLIQNDRLAVIARYPVFRNPASPPASPADAGERFWGFAISIIYLDELLPPIFAAAVQGDFEVLIIGSNPDASDGLELFRSPGFTQDEADISIPISVPNGRWTMYLGSETSAGLPPVLYRLAYLLIGGTATLLFIFQRRSSWRQRVMIHRLNERLLEESTHDELTGLLNRRGFNDLFFQMHQLAHRYEEPYCICLIDADNFKEINDSFGHDAGDKVLRALGRLFLDHLRKTDVICRYGGDEFLILLPRTEFEAGIVIIENFRKAVHDLTVPGAPDIGSMSISAGIIPGDISAHDVELTDLLIAADGKLYEAKEAGRDAVIG